MPKRWFGLSWTCEQDFRTCIRKFTAEPNSNLHLDLLVYGRHIAYIRHAVLSIRVSVVTFPKELFNTSRDTTSTCHICGWLINESLSVNFSTRNKRHWIRPHPHRVHLQSRASWPRQTTTIDLQCPMARPLLIDYRDGFVDAKCMYPAMWRVLNTPCNMLFNAITLVHDSNYGSITFIHNIVYFPLIGSVWQMFTFFILFSITC